MSKTGQNFPELAVQFMAAPVIVPHKYELLPIGSARPHPRNPRLGDLESITDSIAVNGFFGAIVVQESTGFILIGNHRWIAARDAGFTEVPALIIDVDDDRAARIMVADNEIANGARWAPAALAELLGGLMTTEAELAGTGFDAAKYARLIGRWNGNPDPDDAGLEPPEAVTVPGDLWRLGAHRLLCADSTEAEAVARLMAGETAGLMVTDPPYLVNYTGGNKPHMTVNRSARPWDASGGPGAAVAFYSAYLAAALPHLAPAAPVYQWLADSLRVEVDSAWRSAGLAVRQVCYWVKPAVISHAHFMGKVEPCYYGWRPGNEPPKRRRPPASAPNLWDVVKVHANDRGHPTEKPALLWTDPYSWHLRAGEIALEPFSGSGTGIAAAEVSGRRCFALERDPGYCDVACARFQRLTGTLPVRERDGVAVDFVGGASDG
jgi:DNA modification methylase